LKEFHSEIPAEKVHKFSLYGRKVDEMSHNKLINLDNFVLSLSFLYKSTMQNRIEFAESQVSPAELTKLRTVFDQHATKFKARSFDNLEELKRLMAEYTNNTPDLSPEKVVHSTF